ncbi:MAG: LytR/AlgR family response regulator transcription factor [Lachnospiraceae bacterium]
MNIAIIEDLQEDSELLLRLLTEYMKRYNFTPKIMCFQSGEIFLTAGPEQFDLCFMDIYMNGITGVETAERLRVIAPDCLVIFLTSSTDYINDAFRLRAWRYVLKPITMERLYEALPECIEQTQLFKRQLSVMINRRMMELSFSSIYYITTAGRCIEIHGKDIILTTGTQTTFEELATPLLEDYRFFAISKGVVVNFNYVESMNKTDVLMVNGALLPISRGKQAEVSTAFVRFRFEQR